MTGETAEKVTINELLTRHHEQTLQSHQENKHVFEELNEQMRRVSSSLLTQGALNSVPVFSGKEDFSEWIQSIEKCQSIHGLSDKDSCQLTWAKAKGTVSCLIGRILREQPETTFKDLKTILKKEYGKTVDRQQGFIQLTNIRQGREEDITSYTERLLLLAKQAYGEDWKSNKDEYVEDQLVSVFMEGLRSHEIKLRIYRKEVRKIDEAIQIAKTEDIIKKRFPGTDGSSRRFDRITPPEHRDGGWQRTEPRREEPMEVEHSRHRGCFNCGGPHSQRNCQRRESPSKRINTVHNQSHRHKAKAQWIKEEDRKYRRCYNCHMTGHFIAQCRKKRLN